MSLLKEKLAAERKEEQSWRDELREISGQYYKVHSTYTYVNIKFYSCHIAVHILASDYWYYVPADFSSDAEEKHTTYLKERTQLLKQYKVNSTASCTFFRLITPSLILYSWTFIRLYQPMPHWQSTTANCRSSSFKPRHWL